MRGLQRIEVESFGSLRHLAIDVPDGLLVVYGPNEAGKSTLLAAINAAINGISRGTVPAGMAPRDQRVLMTVDGTTYACTHQGHFIDHDRVASPWAEAARATWRTTYGVDQDRLRDGGRSLMDGGGDLADIIFAAHEGFTGSRLIDALTSEANELFKRQGNSRIKALAASVKELEQQAESSTVDPQRLETLRRHLAEAAAVLERATAQRTAAVQRLHEAQQDVRAHPAVDEIVRLRAHAAELHARAPFDGPTAEHVERGIARLVELEDERRDLAERIGVLESEITGSPAADAILGDRDAVSRLTLQLSAAKTARSAMVTMRHAADGHRITARESLRSLGAEIALDDEGAIRAACSDVAIPVDDRASLTAMSAEVDLRRRDLAKAQQHRQDRADELSDYDEANPTTGSDVTALVIEAREHRDRLWAEIQQGRGDAGAFVDAVHAADDAADTAIGRAAEAATRTMLALAHTRSAAEEARARTLLDDAENGWQRLREALGLPATATPQGWTAREDVLTSLDSTVASWDRALADLNAAAETWNSFESEVLAVGATYAEHGDAEQVIEALSRRLAEAQAAEEMLQRSTDVLAVTRDRHATATAELDALNDELRPIADHHASGEVSGLRAVVSASRDYLDIVDRIHARREGLRNAFATDALIDAAIERLSSRALVEVEDEAAAAERDSANAHESYDTARDAVTEARRELDDTLAADNSVELAQRLSNARAELAECVEAYLQLTVQVEILRRERDRLFEDRGSQTIVRAGELLSRLTGGRYVAMATTEAAGTRRIHVYRADEMDCRIDELSEGTVDQVFLALRLAALAARLEQDSAAGLTALPIVLDDILMAYDDHRSQATLEALAEWAQGSPVMLTTHHRGVRDMAQALGIPVVDLSAPVALEASVDEDDFRRKRSRPLGDAVGDVIEVPRAELGRRARDWAVAQGIEVPSRGRTPLTVIDAYTEANPHIVIV